jgi:hypothetical protein
VPPLPPANVRGQITLKTSSTNVPVISVTALVVIQPAVVVTPSQIILPAGPVANPRPYTVSIRNNGATPLTLSEPAVSAKDVDVQMKEVEPGRQFALTLTFPTGFEIASGESVELSVKSSHSQFQVIRVPVRQLPRRVPAMVQPRRGPPAPVNQPPPPPPASRS